MLPLTRETGKPVDVNPNHILYAEPHGKGSILYLADNTTMVVQQSLEDIRQLLSHDSLPSIAAAV